MLIICMAFSFPAVADNKTKGIKDIAEQYCIDVPYGNNNSTPKEILNVASKKISSMRSEGLVPLASEGPTITTSAETSQICIRAIAIRPQPVELF